MGLISDNLASLGSTITSQSTVLIIYYLEMKGTQMLRISAQWTKTKAR